MTPTLERLKQEITGLSQKERAELAAFLVDSLDAAELAELDGDLDDGTPEEIQAAWRMEIERRLAQIRSGTVKGIPAEEVFAEMRKKYP
jgi:putative addiction module component (TIGR02574 family)